MKTPAGMTERETVAVINRVIVKVAPKYRFGYHTDEDMIQYAFIEAIKVINAGKFRPPPGGNVAKQLEVFLRVHIPLRLLNLIRKQSCRYANRETVLNQTKYNLMHPLLAGDDITYVGTAEEDYEAVEREELIVKIRSSLTPTELKDFLKLMGGATVPKPRKEALYERLLDILLGDENEKAS